MENFRLPSPVWKKIDQTFSITGNRKELLELFPEPYVDFLQQVVRYNGALNYELFEGEVSEDVDDYIEHYHKLRQYADLGMRKEAWEEYHFIEANYDICHPYILTDFIKKQEFPYLFRDATEKVLFMYKSTQNKACLSN